MKSIFYSCILILLFHASSVHGQFGLGIVTGGDIYQKYANPVDNIASNTAGNVILNSVLGLKIWVGTKKVSISGEIPFNIGYTGLSREDYKGLGMGAMPFIGMLNFLGTSALDREAGVGFGIGGGIMRYKTELFGLQDEWQAMGVTRNWEQVYVAQAEVGFGVTGFSGKLYARYGWNPENEDLRTFNIGFLTDFNFLMMRKIKDPASSL